MEARPIGARSLATAKILIVDDKADNLLALEAILQPLGLELVRAQSGEQALSAILAEEFALILLDVRMPGLDGFETAQAIKGRDRSRHTPIIFLTANDAPTDIAQAYKNGAVDFLVKPWNATILRAKVAVFVELFQQRHENTRHEVERLVLEQRELRLRERNHLLTLETEVSAALGARASLAEALSRVATTLVQHLDAALVRLWTVSDDGAVLELQASAGMYTSLDGAHARVPVGQLTIGMIAAERKAHLTHQVVGDASLGDPAWAKQNKIVAFAGYPILLGDRLLGVIAAFARHRFSDTSLSTLHAVAGSVGQGIDRAQAEQRLRESEAWLSTTLTGIGDGVIATDPAGLVTFLNPVAESLTGWVSAEARGRPLSEIFPILHEPSRQRIESPFSKVLRQGAIVGMTNHTLLVRRDGTEIPIDDSAAPIRGASGSLAGVVLVFRDASEKRRVELERLRLLDEAQHARDHLHSLFMQTPTPICILRGPEHHFELCNPMYRQLVGNRELIGMPIREALPELDGQPFFELLDRVYTTGERFVGHEVVVKLARQPHITKQAANGEGSATASAKQAPTKDGPEDSLDTTRGDEIEEAILDFVYEPYRDVGGAIAGILVIALEVTETVRARESLQGMLTERQHLLDMAEESRERAEVASRAKDEFLATASHELRTPLNAILGWAQMLRSGRLDANGYARGAETIERNAKAQVRVIEDILDGSRIITGQLKLETRPLDMVVLVRAALDSVRSAADAKNIELTSELEPAAAQVSGDPDRLQQVVWNLANNAIKFTPKGGRVVVQLVRSGTSIELRVHDSGEGIAAEFLPHVFERFRQAEGSTTRRHGGLGLGLALVRHLVEAHGGTVRAASEGLGRGSTFTVTLPVPALRVDVGATGRAKSDPCARPSTFPPGPSPTSPTLHGVQVLVVDDEVDARDLVATVLRTSGAQVTTAANAEAALAALTLEVPGLLISDIGMPGTDGYELIRRVRARGGTSTTELPAIALTAYAREEDRRRAIEAGFQTHVTKPVEPAELLRVVSSLVQGKTE